jgi:hypothetical protein
MKLSPAGVKLSKFTKLSLVAGGVLFFAWLGLTLLSGDGPKKSGPARVDDSACPDCGRPLTRQAKTTGECPFCKMEDPTMQKKKARLSGGGGLPFSSRWIAVGIVVTFVLLLVANVAVFVRTALTRKTPGDDLLHMNCRKCDRRVRYRLRQAGALARCPSCLSLIRFPELPEKKTPWSIVKGWLTIPRKKRVRQDSA